MTRSSKVKISDLSLWAQQARAQVLKDRRTSKKRLQDWKEKYNSARVGRVVPGDAKKGQDIEKVEDSFDPGFWNCNVPMESPVSDLAVTLRNAVFTMVRCEDPAAWYDDVMQKLQSVMQPFMVQHRNKAAASVNVCPHHDAKPDVALPTARWFKPLFTNLGNKTGGVPSHWEPVPDGEDEYYSPFCSSEASSEYTTQVQCPVCSQRFLWYV